jgi:hypothetical protein
MLGKNIIRKSVTLMTAVAVWCVYSMVAYAIPGDIAGEITVSGQVTVNGQPAVSNSTILSGSVISTGDGSSAVISLGKAGKLELSANTSMTLRFTDNSIVVMLSDGKTRIQNAAGVATTVTTKHATMIADVGQSDNFTVEAECAHTHLDTHAGVVTMREGTSDKQISAGASAIAGNMEQAGCQPCFRGTQPQPNIGNWPWLLLLAAGAAGAGIFLSTRKDDFGFGGGGTVVSPVR